MYVTVPPGKVCCVPGGAIDTLWTVVTVTASTMKSVTAPLVVEEVVNVTLYVFTALFPLPEAKTADF